MAARESLYGLIWRLKHIARSSSCVRPKIGLEKSCLASPKFRDLHPGSFTALLRVQPDSTLTNYCEIEQPLRVHVSILRVFAMQARFA